MIRYLLKDNSSDVSFPISKRLTFLDYFVYAVFKVHVRSAHMQIAQSPTGARPTQVCFADTSQDIAYGTFLYFTKDSLRLRSFHLTDVLSVIMILNPFKTLITGKTSFFFCMILASTYSPTPSPVQYHRPLGS